MASRFTAFGLARLQQSSVYDGLMRLPMLAWATLAVTVSMADLARHCGKAGPVLPNAVSTVTIPMRLSTIAFFLLVAASVVLRRRPVGRARGFEPRVSAMIGGLLIYALGLFPRRDLSPAAETVSTVLMLGGSGGYRQCRVVWRIRDHLGIEYFDDRAI